MDWLIGIPVFYFLGFALGLLRIIHIQTEMSFTTRRFERSQEDRSISALYDAFFWPVVVINLLYREHRRRFPKKSLDSTTDSVTMDFGDDELKEAFEELEQEMKKTA